jgi:molybdopterin converting factor small subunit
MEIKLKCFATLAETDKCDYRDTTPKTLQEGATVRDLLVQMAMPEKDVQLVFLNGQKVGFDTVLRNGDQIGLAPATGGM